MKSEKEESLFPPFKSSLRRQTATAQLMGPFQASAEEANQVKQNVAEQLEEVKGATFSSQANGCRYQPHTQAQPTPQHCSDSQSQHTRSPTIPPDLAVDSTKVHCRKVQRVAFMLHTCFDLMLKRTVWIWDFIKLDPSAIPLVIFRYIKLNWPCQ